MGLFIRPFEVVESEGRKLIIRCPWEGAQMQLEPGEQIAAVRSGIAILIKDEATYEQARLAGCENMYAITEELANTAV